MHEETLVNKVFITNNDTSQSEWIATVTFILNELNMISKTQTLTPHRNLYTYMQGKAKKKHLFDNGIIL